MKIYKVLLLWGSLLMLSGCSDEPKNIVESNIMNLKVAATGGKYDEQKFYDQISLEDKEIIFPRGKFSPAVVTPLAASYLMILSQIDNFEVARSDIDKNKAIVHAHLTLKDKSNIYIKFRLLKEDSGWKIILRETTWNANPYH